MDLPYEEFLASAKLDESSELALSCLSKFLHSPSATGQNMSITWSGSDCVSMMVSDLNDQEVIEMSNCQEMVEIYERLEAKRKISKACAKATTYYMEKNRPFNSITPWTKRDNANHPHGNLRPKNTLNTEGTRGASSSSSYSLITVTGSGTSYSRSATSRSTSACSNGSCSVLF